MFEQLTLQELAAHISLVEVSTGHANQVADSQEGNADHQIVGDVQEEGRASENRKQHPTGERGGEISQTRQCVCRNDDNNQAGDVCGKPTRFNGNLDGHHPNPGSQEGEA